MGNIRDILQYFWDQKNTECYKSIAIYCFLLIISYMAVQILNSVYAVFLFAVSLIRVSKKLALLKNLSTKFSFILDFLFAVQNNRNLSSTNYEGNLYLVLHWRHNNSFFGAIHSNNRWHFWHVFWSLSQVWHFHSKKWDFKIFSQSNKKYKIHMQLDKL